MGKNHFKYLRDSNGHLIACIASIKLTTMNGNSIVAYNLSTRHQADEVDKVLAKELASSRLKLDPKVIPIDNTASAHEIAHLIMSSIMFDSSAPTRVRKAAKLWIKTAAELSCSQEC